MVKTKDEILASLKEIIGENSDDKTITFLEDVSDTFAEYESKIGEDWKTKYEDNDKAWRERYRARFFDGGAVEPSPSPDDVIKRHENDAQEESESLSYDELFEKREM